MTLPDWLSQYSRQQASGDLVAGLIVTVMLIPQSLAYAMLAGLPPQMGLYASILPLIAYAALGSSMTLAVGPVAVASLMTAHALAPIAAPGSAEYIAGAVLLAALSGVMLLALGLLKFGFLAHFLSHPVISGFITGSALLIALTQLGPLLGIRLPSGTVWEVLPALIARLPEFNPATLALGVVALILLVFARRGLPSLLVRAGLSASGAGMAARLMPMLVVLLSIALVSSRDLHLTHRVAVVGEIPAGLPSLGLVMPELDLLQALWLPALLISLVGFVESVSVAQSLALQRQQRICPDRELLGLGAANLASALSGGYPVTGGFARSVVNFSAGAQTPLAGVVSALLMAIVLLGFTGVFETLPHAVLAATIIVAVLGLVDFGALRRAWRHDRADGLAGLATAAGVLLWGVEPGIVLGVGLSLAAFLWRASRPHMAVIGRVPGTEHYRNIHRHQVQTHPGVLALRVDEGLFFGNIQALEDEVMGQLAKAPATRHVLLVLSAVNHIDSTALEGLAQLRRALAQRGITLNLAEVKGPVMDRLARSDFLAGLQNPVFLSTHQAMEALCNTAQAGSSQAV
jgi:SulP family sulfate permease